MSTPVSIEPPPRAHLRTDSEQERDLQAKLQRMITLQNEEQHISGGMLAERKDSPRGLGLLPPREPGRTIGSLPRRTNAETKSSLDVGNHGERNANSSPIPWPSLIDGGLPPSPQQGVGRGTLYFPHTYQSGLNRNSEPIDYLQMNVPQQIHTSYGAVTEQQHEFYYGNPDYHDPYSMKPRNQKSCCEKICCLYRPLVNLLSQEQLQRSFCFGAIDGMLTGSGIVSAFWALGVLTQDTQDEVRVAVVVFSAAACFADSICMGLGHIWTSFVVSSGHAYWRFRERGLLDENKGDAKAKLVDMLLARGMLKIDAMSLADTLEGYPDLFVSALVGDSLLAGRDEEDPETDDDTPHSRNGSLGWKFPSYGQFDEMAHDPEASNVNMAVAESRREGFCMMIGFASFAIIPSLLWLYVPLAFPATSDTIPNTISYPSIVITITAVIMWCLGVWKSRFLDSNWVMFGIETVIVLLICVVSAYGMGFWLSTFVGSPGRFTLTRSVN